MAAEFEFIAWEVSVLMLFKREGSLSAEISACFERWNKPSI